MVDHKRGASLSKARHIQPRSWLLAWAAYFTEQQAIGQPPKVVNAGATSVHASEKNLAAFFVHLVAANVFGANATCNRVGVKTCVRPTPQTQSTLLSPR